MTMPSKRFAGKFSSRLLLKELLLSFLTARAGSHKQGVGYSQYCLSSRLYSS